MAFSAIKPEASVFANPAEALYLQTVARNAMQPGGNLSQYALSRYAKSGDSQQAYLDALDRANKNQLAGSAAENASELDKAYITALAPMSQAGIAGGVTIPGSAVQVNQPYLGTVDTVATDAVAQGAFADRAKGTAELLGAGVKPTNEYIGQSIAGPLDTETPVVTDGYLTPAKQTDRMQAQNGAVTAQASMVRANREPTAKELQASMVMSGYGLLPVVTYKGPASKIEALQQQGGGSATPQVKGKDMRRVIVQNGRVVPNPNYGK